MSYRDLSLKYCYETTEDKERLLEDFYIPMLENTIDYYRVAGFFSSSSLIVASKGIEKMVTNGGKMRLLVSPELSEEDYETIKNSLDKKLSMESVFERNFEFESCPNQRRLDLLAWMIENDKLEIKVAVDPKNSNGLFHQKFGFGYDINGDSVSFSGSINESAQGWLVNTEEFKVFRSWEPGQKCYMDPDINRFNEYWDNKRDNVEVYDISDCVKKRIIHFRKDYSEYKVVSQYFDKKKFEEENESVKSFEDMLFDHQKRAIDQWEENNYSMLFEMATGTGKTFTAIGCMRRLMKKKGHLLVIVTTPQNTLSRQWEKEIKEHCCPFPFDKSLIADGTNSKWEAELRNTLKEMVCDDQSNVIVYTTHDTSSSNRFTSAVREDSDLFNILYICDEVHGIGSEKRRNSLLDCYRYRIGLSATPQRMYDDKGNELIQDYFGSKTFEFTIHDALNTINPKTNRPFLNPFYYYPRFTTLTDDELNNYKKYSKWIASLIDSEDHEEIEKRHQYEISRARIVKEAVNKSDVVKGIIEEIGLKDKKVRDVMIFLTKEHMDNIREYLRERHIVSAKITQEESAAKNTRNNSRGLSEREELIDSFREGRTQVLVGIECLDEGLDIKSARTAILVSSSANPREYVQRIGRVIRDVEGKEPSVVYDILIEPENEEASTDKLLEKEARRALMIAENAINYEEIKQLFIEKGVKTNGDQFED